ncbi:MAG: type II CRISPR-associated endonuclease Cas1 [Methylophilaceae bacterium]|nr:type II CRISPR-associated endonuclease Cas1 [Methylophilaceae bacterium]
MVWRSILISQPAKLKRQHFSLIIEQNEVAQVPFEDIAVIVLNHCEITLTHAVLSACGEYGIGLFSTGNNHQPNGVFTPYLQHTRAVRGLRLQLGLPKPVAKQTWTRIVRQKISNQVAALRYSSVEERRLAGYMMRVRSGDVANMEGLAASVYFPRLFGKGFTREQECFVNAALDYGYAVLRGAIARGLVAHGLLPAVGIFHASELNAFNLADDLIEALRPLVDLRVKNMLYTEGDLCPQDKAALVKLLHFDVAMPRGQMSVLAAIEQMVESLVRVLEQQQASLIELPTLIGLVEHSLEC